MPARHYRPNIVPYLNELRMFLKCYHQLALRIHVEFVNGMTHPLPDLRYRRSVRFLVSFP